MEGGRKRRGYLKERVTYRGGSHVSPRRIKKQRPPQPMLRSTRIPCPAGRASKSTSAANLESRLSPFPLPAPKPRLPLVMGLTKAAKDRWKTSIRDRSAAGKASAAAADPSASPSVPGEDGPPPPKRTKLTSSSSAGSRARKHDDKLTKAFFPVGLPRKEEAGEENEGERELDEAERYLLSVR